MPPATQETVDQTVIAPSASLCPLGQIMPIVIVSAEKCPLCDEVYDNKIRIPHILYCKHSLCHVCLSTLCKPDDTLVNCPFCKVDAKLYAMGSLDETILIESTVFSQRNEDYTTENSIHELIEETPKFELCKDQHGSATSFYCEQVRVFLQYCGRIVFRYFFHYSHYLRRCGH